MKLNRVLLISISLICLFFLTGCTTNGQGVETKAYVIAMGIDKRRYRYAKTISTSCYFKWF